jgi:hypothetical protein
VFAVVVELEHAKRADRLADRSRPPLMLHYGIITP